MMEDDKPFVCSQKGCGQKFTNEDHLAVHMKKHEMSLALNLNTSDPGPQTSGKSPMSSLGPPGGLFLDQTPTPTKFLKNIEEIGLFQELNKNPFEEAFKKASLCLEVDGHVVSHLPSSPFPGPESNELNTPVPPIPKVSVSNQSFRMFTKLPSRTEDQDHSGTHALNLSRRSSPQASHSSSGNQQDEIIDVINRSVNVTVDETGYHVVHTQPSSTVTSQIPSTSVVTSALGSDAISDPIMRTFIQETLLASGVESTEAVSSAVAVSNSLFTTISQPSIASTVKPLEVTNSSFSSQQHQQQQQVPQPQISQILTTAPQLTTCMQVLLQLPSGQTIPVQIPATITGAGQQILAHQKAQVSPQADNLAQQLNLLSSLTSIPQSQTQHQVQQQQQQQAQSSVIMQTTAARQTGSTMSQNYTQIQSVTPTSSSSQSSITKQRLKAALQMQNSPSPSSSQKSFPQSQNMSPDSNQVTIISSTTNLPSMGADPVSSPDSDSSSVKRLRTDDDPDDRRKKFLERNRAAAARCRQKRKHWITNLEKKGDELQGHNNRLQTEVNQLKAEVASLKTMLLAHKDCPVTLQQKALGQFPFQTLSVVEDSSASAVVAGGSIQPVSSEVKQEGFPTFASATGTMLKTISPVPSNLGVTIPVHKAITIIPKVVRTEKNIRKK